MLVAIAENLIFLCLRVDLIFVVLLGSLLILHSSCQKRRGTFWIDSVSFVIRIAAGNLSLLLFGSSKCVFGFAAPPRSKNNANL